MATFDLAGAGTRGLTSGTTHLFVDLVVLGPGYSTGRATPTNYFHLGLIRAMFHGSAYPVIPVDAFNMIIELPRETDGLGWSLTSGTSVHVTEAAL